MAGRGRGPSPPNGLPAPSWPAWSTTAAYPTCRGGCGCRPGCTARRPGRSGTSPPASATPAECGTLSGTPGIRGRACTGGTGGGPGTGGTRGIRGTGGTCGIAGAGRLSLPGGGENVGFEVVHELLQQLGGDIGHDPPAELGHPAAHRHI